MGCEIPGTDPTVRSPRLPLGLATPHRTWLPAGRKQPQTPPGAPRDAGHVPQPPRPSRFRVFGGTPPRCSREHRKSRQRCRSKKAAGRRESGGREGGCRSRGGAAGAAGGQHLPESGPRPFLGCRLPGKQRVNDRVRSLAKLRPLRAGGSSRDPTARSGEGTSPPSPRGHGQGPTTTGRD